MVRMRENLTHRHNTKKYLQHSLRECMWKRFTAATLHRQQNCDIKEIDVYVLETHNPSPLKKYVLFFRINGMESKMNFSA